MAGRLHQIGRNDWQKASSLENRRIADLTRREAGKLADEKLRSLNQGDMHDNPQLFCRISRNSISSPISFVRSNSRRRSAITVI
jgi:hypothetical protein